MVGAGPEPAEEYRSTLHGFRSFTSTDGNPVLTDSAHALVVGATGIAGGALIDRLSGEGWAVTGLSRRPGAERPGVGWRSADLRSPESLREALGDLPVTHVFFTAWSRQDTEAENIAVNGGMVRDLLAALSDAPVRHVALMTGLKHYLGPFEAYGQGEMPDTPSTRTSRDSTSTTSTTRRRTSCSPPPAVRASRGRSTVRTRFSAMPSATR